MDKNTPQKGLADLATAAHREVERQERKVATPEQPRDNSRTRAALAVCAAAGAAVAAYVMAAPYLLGVSERALVGDLTAAVTAARDDIENQRKQTGNLPERLANPALALFVDYRRSGTGYQLVGSDGFHTVEMDDQGTVKESKATR
jgi:hypothetical protein